MKNTLLLLCAFLAILNSHAQISTVSTTSSEMKGSPLVPAIGGSVGNTGKKKKMRWPSGLISTGAQ